MNGQTVTLIGAFVMFFAAFLFGLYIFCDMWMLRQKRWDVVDWQVKLLRSKLGKYRDMIQTIRGVGYKFEVSG